MPVDRPTFSESWYRVAQLRPRLRATVQVHRQHFRGQMWHVLQDPSNNQFYRLNDPAYRFVALLDGKRTVAETWKICNEQFGDMAPTQGEVIQIMGQLYTSNLLHAEMPPDAEGLFTRYKKRITREVQGYLMNLLFIRIPLLDPDHFLDRWISLVSWIYSYAGLIIWTVLLSVGGYFAVTHWSELFNQKDGILEESNLPLLYLCFIFVKIFHELGHAFSCKKFGRQTGSGGEVHVLGVMFLIFTPMPYVDASSSWAFRKKWHRIIVGAAGMWVELAIAAIATIVWANVSGGAAKAIAYNVMFISSVSTLLFNGNPLLRYDGYYMLSDLLEIPNLAQRAKQYYYYLVKKYCWNVRQARNPAHTQGETFWFVLYGFASSIYRVLILVSILLFVAQKLFIVGAILAIASAVAWLFVPVFKFIHYLATSNELFRVRGRAVGSTLAAVVLLVGSISLIPAPDRTRFEGVVEPVELVLVNTRSDGYIKNMLESGRYVQPGKDVLLEEENPELEIQLESLQAQREQVLAQRRKAKSESEAAAQVLDKNLLAIDESIKTCQDKLSNLKLKPLIAGRWVSLELDKVKGAYLKQGQQAGMVMGDELLIRGIAIQNVGKDLMEEIELRDNGKVRHVEMRVKGRPDLAVTGTIVKVLRAGQENLPSAALGYQAGGSIQTASDDKKGLKAAEDFFEVRIKPDSSNFELFSGQRVVIRVSMPEKTLANQWWRSLRQLYQRGFQVNNSAV